jgi:nuclear transport factor 2 (NTF2) superfamily protein
MSRPPLPPFTEQSAFVKARLAEDGWNSRDARARHAMLERIAASDILATADVPSTGWWELVDRFWDRREPSPDYWGSMIIKDPVIDPQRRTYSNQ